jgi:hypothetical protein
MIKDATGREIGLGDKVVVVTNSYSKVRMTQATVTELRECLYTHTGEVRCKARAEGPFGGYPRNSTRFINLSRTVIIEKAGAAK